MNDNSSRHSDSSGIRRDGSRSLGQHSAATAAIGAPQRLHLNRELLGSRTRMKDDIIRVLPLPSSHYVHSTPHVPNRAWIQMGLIGGSLRAAHDDSTYVLRYSSYFKLTTLYDF